VKNRKNASIMKENKIDRILINILTKFKRTSTIIENACGNAYEIGFKNGMIEGAKVNGKKYANKVAKALKNQYKI
tara:strand:+ start:2689 stop:2913 length:225 start_codon:yes stop_codon:yes gene_type:complete